MKEVRETFIGHKFVLLSVEGNLVSIHADHGHLDGTSKVKVIVAQVVGVGLKLILIQARCIISHFVKDWLGCSDSSLVRNQIEVKLSISLILNKSLVKDSARTWIQAVTALFVEKSVLNVSVNKAINDLGSIPRSCVFKKS